jgi:hypothetical protein
MPHLANQLLQNTIRGLNEAIGMVVKGKTIAVTGREGP